MTVTTLEPRTELDESLLDDEPPLCSWPGCDHDAHWSVVFTCTCSALLCSCCLFDFHKMADQVVNIGGNYTCPLCHTKFPLVAGAKFFDQVIKEVLPI